MKKPVAIALSDLHLHYWKKLNAGGARLENQMEVLRGVWAEAKRLNIPIIFNGDMFHTPKSLSNKLLNTVLPEIVRLFNRSDSPDMYAISGNHDQAEQNFNVDRQSPSYIHLLSKLTKHIHCLDFCSLKVNGIGLHGIPYLTHNMHLQESLENIAMFDNKLNILLLHTDYPGAQDTDNREVGSVEGFNKRIYNMISNYDLVTLGHIHKAQLLRQGVYMIGCPLHMRLTDENAKLGYAVIYKDKTGLSLRFQHLKGFPEFRRYKNESEITNNTDYWVKIPEEKRLELSNSLSSSGTSIKKLVKKYCKTNEITSKKKKNALINILTEFRDDQI